MSTTRFVWARSSEHEIVAELYKRAYIDKSVTVVRAYKKLDQQCIICKKKLKEGDHYVLPTNSPNKDNKIAAHESCLVEAYKRQMTNAGASVFGSLPHTPSQSRPPVHAAQEPALGARVSLMTPSGHAVESLVAIEEMRKKIWEEGYNAGLADAMAALTGTKNEQNRPKR